MSKPRKLSLVTFDFTNLPKEYHKKYPFKAGETYLFLGEIPNMPHHCAVVKKDGTVVFGYHTSDFIEVPDDQT